uniref:Uncharacterized protein n=1 Tax=Panagrellus redivivus TaxID=6233 RepID=A0A7E4W0U7_PANRE
MTKNGTYIVNQLPENQICLCGIHVRRGAKILATIVAVYSIVSLIYSAAASVDKPMNTVPVGLMAVNAVAAILVLIGERQNRAKLFIPALIVLLINILAVTIVFVTSVVFGVVNPERFQKVIELFIPRLFINDPAKQLQVGQKHQTIKAAVVPENPRERVFFHIATTVLFFVFDLFLGYSFYVIYRAYKYISNIIEAPVTVVNENYKPGDELPLPV